MGVHGLWRLIEPSGKPVPVESLENKVLAVDVSIWLHQAIKGFQDAKGAPAVNAHLLGIFHRVCKLLYFKVKPIFVFDGGVPTLKRETIAKRNKLKLKNITDADKIQKQLLETLLKHSAINKVLADKAKEAIATKSIETKENEDIFKLPETELKTASSDDETDSESPTKHWNLHNIDTRSKNFKSLPADVRHEILTDLKETRKQSSWGRLHELPTQSNEFSGFQMKRLLKRYEVQSALEEAEKEMGGHSLSLAELEDILKDEGVISKNVVGNRIASDENKRYLYIRSLKEALEKARLEEEKKKSAETEDNKEPNEEIQDEEKLLNRADLELEEDLQKAISLSLQDQPSSSNYASKKLSEYSFLENFNDEDFESDDDEEDDKGTPLKITAMSSAQNYMMEYSGLNPNEIARIIAGNEGITRKRKLNTETKASESLEKDVELCEEPETKKLKETSLEKIDEDIEIMSDSEKSDDFEEVENIQEENNPEDLKNLEKSNNSEEVIIEKSDKNITKEDSEDSDDFEDVPVKEEGLEIKIEADKLEEDDLFADIFAPETKDSNLLKPEEPKDSNEKIEDADGKIEDTDTKNKNSIEKVPEQIETRSKLLEELIAKAEKEKVEKNSKITEEDLVKMKDDLNKEQLELRNEQGLRERLGTNITDQMYKEAQDLLELFGLPYVVAPMEAEAQCAFLESVSLTDGTITDDSDIWLFGGKTVYKNFFNQSKHVLEYRAENIKHHFKLSREQMILLALLVGSDYTVGLQGVGPVTALEILAAFPSSNTSTFTLSHNQLLMGLQEFKLWFTNGKTISKKQTLRSKLKNIKITDSFPSPQVVQAYLNPTVDTSEEKFSWSLPNQVALIDFGRKKFGWSKTKVEEILKPVIKKIKETKYQSTLLNYFKINHNLSAEQAQKLMSERVKTAVKRIGQDPQDDEEEEEKPKAEKTKQDKKRKKKAEVKTSSLSDDDIEMDKIESILESIEKNGKASETTEQTKDETVKETVSKKKITRKTIKKKENSNVSQDEPSTSKYFEEPPKKTLRKPKTVKNTKTLEVVKEVDEDLELKILKETESESQKRMEEIKLEAEKKLQELNKKKTIIRNLHRKEIIPQRERDQKNSVRTRLRAIEVFRKSKIDPSSKKGNARKAVAPKEDAGLSESSSDSC